MSTRRIREDLAAVEAALASLNPTPCGVDRDRMMFRAGRASAEKTSPPGRRPLTSRLWPCATAATTLLAVTFASLWLAGRGQPVAERHLKPSREMGVEEQQAGEHPAAVAPSTEVARDRKRFRTDYLQLRQWVLTRGLDELPQPVAVPPSDAEPSWWRSGDRKALERLLES